MERWVAIEEFGNGSETVVKHLVFVANHLPFDEAQACALIEFEARFHVKSAQPRPCRALMVRVIALYLWSYIHGIVSTALGRQASKPLRRKQLARTNIENALLLTQFQWRIIKAKIMFGRTLQSTILPSTKS